MRAVLHASPRLASLVAVTVLALTLAGCAPRGGPMPPVAPDLPTGFVAAQPGERADQLAARAGVSLDQLAVINGLSAPFQLRPGQILRLPDARGHDVVTGDTVSQIADRYDTSVGVVAALNDLTEPFTIFPGQSLVVPTQVPVTVANRPEFDIGPQDPVVAAAPAGTVTVETLTPPGSDGTVPEPGPAPGTLDPADMPGPPQPLLPPLTTTDPGSPATTAGPTPGAPVDLRPTSERLVSAGPPSGPPAGPPSFAWPVVGDLLSGFGPMADGTHNDGVNISAPRGTAVLAAQSGTVAYAGNELRGFGNLVLVRHADDWVTAYAHLDRILVNRDEEIRMGQPVGTVGDTGTVGEPQLHFEVRRGTEAVDPQGILPSFPR